MRSLNADTQLASSAHATKIRSPLLCATLFRFAHVCLKARDRMRSLNADTQLASSAHATKLTASLLRLFAPDGFFSSGACCRWSGQTHFDLKLLYQFIGLHLLGFFLDLDLLLVHVAQGHIHAGLIDGCFFFDLAHHLVVGLADASDLKLLHSVRYLSLPLGTAMIGNGVERFLRFAVLLTHEGLLHCHSFIEGSARGNQLPLSAGQRAFYLFQLRSKAASDIVAVGLNGCFHLGGEVADIVLVFGLFTLQQGDVGLDHGDTLIHARHLVIHVTNVLLQNEFRVLSHRNEKADERTYHPLEASPHKSSFCLRSFSRFRRSIRCADGAAGCNRILADEIADGISNLFLFLLLFQPPAEEFFFCLGHIVIVLLHFGALFSDQTIHVRLNLAVLFSFARLQIIERTLLDALVAVQRTVATDRILNYILDVDASGVQCYQHRRTFYV